MQYVIHGTSLPDAHCISKEGIGKGYRTHVHFYECDADGRVLGGQTVRSGSEVAIVVSAQQRMDG